MSVHASGVTPVPTGINKQGRLTISVSPTVRHVVNPHHFHCTGEIK